MHPGAEACFAVQVKAGAPADENNKNSISGLTVNDLLRTHKLERFEFVKIDIEGSEKQVFEASAEALSWLKQARNARERCRIRCCSRADVPCAGVVCGGGAARGHEQGRVACHVQRLGSGGHVLPHQQRRVQRLAQ
jgi:hypothetical protein